MVEAVVDGEVVFEAVGPDAFAAFARADHGGALFGAFGVDLFLVVFVESGAEELPGELAVLVLAFGVLHADFDAGGDVEEFDGCGDFVDVLSAWALGGGDVYLDIFILDFDVDLLGFGEDGDGGGGGVDASLGFGLGYAFDAMGSAFVAEVLPDVFAFDVDDGGFAAAHVGGVEFHGVPLPVLCGGVSLVHLEEVVGEDGGFVATYACAEFEDDGVDGFVIGGDEFAFDILEEVGGLPGELGVFGAGEFEEFGVGFGVEDGFEVGGFGGEVLVLLVEGGEGEDGGAFLTDFGDLGVVCGDGGVGELPVVLVQLVEDLVEAVEEGGVGHGGGD